jgi:uncharacterized membrane protein YfcA
MLKGFFGRLYKTGELINEASKAQGKWQLETSNTILMRRKKFLFILFLPVLAGLAMQCAFAAGPAYIGGGHAYMPAVATTQMLCGILVIGLLSGLITGVIGAGGGYVLTPALMTLGVKGIMAVGTDQFAIFANAILGTTLHKKLGNVNLWLAVWFVVGSFAGVTMGASINRQVYALSPALSDAFISTVYVILLGILGFYSTMDYIKLRKGQKDTSRKAIIDVRTSFARWLQSIPLKPRIKFDDHIFEGGMSISVYPVVICGFIVGFVAAIMGVGGGFLTFPLFVYGLGVSTFTTVGTDILQIIFTTAYSSIFNYAIYGYIFYSIAITMLLGSLIGVQIGAMVTTFVKGTTIKLFYALTILAGFVNRLAALPPRLSDANIIAISKETSNILTVIGTVVFFGLVALFGFFVLYTFFTNVIISKKPAKEVSESKKIS